MEEKTIYDKLIEEQLQSLDYSQLETILRMSEYQGENPFSIPSLTEITKTLLRGDLLTDPAAVPGKAAKYFASEILSNSLLFSELIIICIIAAMLRSMTTSSGERGTCFLGQMICNYSAVAVCIGSFTSMYRITAGSIDEMAGFMQALLPMMLTLLLGSGSVATGAAMNPVVLGAINLFTTACDRIILPAIFLSCVFVLVNSLTESSYIRKLAGFIRKGALFLMGLGVLIFSGLSAIQGLVTVPADTLIAKAAKYSVGNLVPVIGGFAADSLDLIKSCTVLIKSAVGVFGVLAILFLLLVPLIKVLAAALIYKLAGILLEPLGEEKLSDCMGEMGDGMVALALVLFLVALMFLIFLTLMVNSGKGAVYG